MKKLKKAQEKPFLTFDFDLQKAKDGLIVSPKAFDIAAGLFLLILDEINEGGMDGCVLKTDRYELVKNGIITDADNRRGYAYLLRLVSEAADAISSLERLYIRDGECESFRLHFLDWEIVDEKYSKNRSLSIVFTLDQQNVKEIRMIANRVFRHFDYGTFITLDTVATKNLYRILCEHKETGEWLVDDSVLRKRFGSRTGMNLKPAQVESRIIHKMAENENVKKEFGQLYWEKITQGRKVVSWGFYFDKPVYRAITKPGPELKNLFNRNFIYRTNSLNIAPETVWSQALNRPDLASLANQYIEMRVENGLPSGPATLRQLFSDLDLLTAGSKNPQTEAAARIEHAIRHGLPFLVPEELLPGPAADRL